MMSYSFQKESILKIVNNTTNHYSVEEIHEELTKIISGVSLMTVYRNLSKLTNEGHVLPFHIDNVLHFCGNNKPHFHFHCVECGKIVDDFNSEIKNIILNHMKSKDFIPLLNGIMIKGLCKNCTVGNCIDKK
jgi:Fe2+ or Zn2+ uptake regulation protein|tara:strand:+ start:98 stop:493 length:396 start_codon:yes stop_codon:yes gene_type:complete